MGHSEACQLRCMVVVAYFREADKGHKACSELFPLAHVPSAFRIECQYFSPRCRKHCGLARQLARQALHTLADGTVACAVVTGLTERACNNGQGVGHSGTHMRAVALGSEMQYRGGLHARRQLRRQQQHSRLGVTRWRIDAVRQPYLLVGDLGGFCTEEGRG